MTGIQPASNLENYFSSRDDWFNVRKVSSLPYLHPMQGHTEADNALQPSNHVEAGYERSNKASEYGYNMIRLRS